MFKAYSCRVQEFSAISFVKANGRVSAIPTESTNSDMGLAFALANVIVLLTSTVCACSKIKLYTEN